MENLDDSILYKEEKCEVCAKKTEFKVGDLHICPNCKPSFLEKYENFREQLNYDQMLSILTNLKQTTKSLSEMVPNDVKPPIKEIWDATNSQEKWVNQVANLIIIKTIQAIRIENSTLLEE